MSHYPRSNYGDEPPAYLDEASSFLPEHESPTATRNGATMRLLPTAGDNSDLSGSPGAPSSYQSDYDDSTP